MGSNETATATTGGSRVIPYKFDGDGVRSGPNYLLFSDADRSRARSGTGLGSGSRRHRMRPCLGLSRELWIENFSKPWPSELYSDASWPDVSDAGSGGACGVGDCTCLVPTPSAPRETSGPRIDRISPAHPPWRRRQFRELKKLIFSAPGKCPIDLFGPRANRTILKRLRVVFCLWLHSVLHRYAQLLQHRFDCRYRMPNRALRQRASHASTPANAPLPHCICIDALTAHHKPHCTRQQTV